MGVGVGQSTHEPEVQLDIESTEERTESSPGKSSSGKSSPGNIDHTTNSAVSAPGNRSHSTENSAAGKGSATAVSEVPSRHSHGAKSGIGRQLLWFTAFLMTAGVSTCLGAAIALFAPLPIAQDAPDSNQISLSRIWRMGFGYRITRPVNILVMGIDRVLDVPQDSPDIFSGRSDTMLLVRIDPTTNSVSVLSIPRDTQVAIPGEGIHKINHANTVGGAELAAQVVRENLDDIPIDRYVRVSTSAFRELVDLLGGVRVFVPERMEYVDNTQKLYINLEQGWQVLNGEQAEQFARFRKDSYGDVGRVQRQQQVIRALRDRLSDPTVIAKLPAAIELLQNYIDTNLSLDEMLALANFGLNLNQENFRMVMLPGRFSGPNEYVASYWIMDPEGRDQIMREYFAVDSVEVAESNVNRLRIAVQNASGEPTLARQLARHLRSQGFRNVYVVRDWPDQQQETQIIVQRGDLRGASTLETVLGVGQVVPASTGDLDSDLTIRVGSDWSQRLEEL